MNKIKKYGFAVGILVVLLHALPYIILGQDSHISIHDNLDSAFIYYVILARGAQVLNYHSVIEQVMNGIPRMCFPSGLSVVTWLFLFFKPFVAYVINELLVHLFAFVGMYLVLRKHFLRDESNIPIVLGVSLCFALLPVYSIFGLAITGQPLLLYAFLNLRNKEYGIIDFLIILIFPFYSQLVLSGAFILFFLCIILLYDWFKNKRINKIFMSGIVILSATYMVVEYGLITNMFFNEGFIPNRILVSAEGYGFRQAVWNGFVKFYYGVSGSMSLHIFILAISLLTMVALLLKKDGLREKNAKLLFGLLVTAFLISMFSSFFYWDGLRLLKEKFALLREFRFDRVNWLHPVLWYLIFAITLSIIMRIRYGKYIVFFLLAIQLSYAAVQSVNKGYYEKYVSANQITYREFFSEDLFGEIGRFINSPQKDYRVVSIGIHPSIAQYNGFYTLDSYQNNYPLEYHHKFRRIIEKELNKNPRRLRYFDHWGSRCYVFVAELENAGFLITKDKKIQVDNLELNTNALKEMGGKYIFSAVEVRNAGYNNLKLLKVFEKDKLPWRIYLYEVN
jgi:hypothetical protein